MIKANQLSRRYGDFTAVDEVSFSIEKGQIVGLLGHNGAGKTTIMKMITGCLEPSEGSASINGLDVNENLMAVQSKIGYLPETSPVYPEMPVAMYLEYLAELRQIPSAKRVQAIRDALKQTELMERADSIISTLSKGLKQRVGIAQAIIHNPEILILDEPTSGLDPSQIDEIRRLIKELSSSSTIILSTHILQEVEAICDRVLILSGGKLVVDENLSNLTQSDSLIVSIKSNEEDVEARLKNVAGVSSISTQANGDGKILRVLISDKIDSVGPEIAKTVIEAGSSLRALQPERKSLETVFRNVTAA